MKYLPYQKISFCLLILLTVCTSSFAQIQTGTNFKTIINTNGPTLGYSANSGVTIFTINELHFKDLNKNGKLDAYEDWRLSVDTTAKDLAGK